MSKLASPIVSVDWLVAHIEDPAVVIADVRPLDAYLAGHIPGAISVDLSMLRLPSSAEATVAAWSQRLASFVAANGFGPDKTVVFYEDFSGTMSAYGVWLLDAAGLGNGAMLDGGLRAWYEAGNAVADDQVEPVASEITVEPDLAVLQLADQIVAGLSDGSGEQLVDARGIHEYKMGAIPGAVHVEWMNNLNASGAFRPVDELEQLYAGLDKDAPVASYCAGGIRAANTYVVLKSLGFSDARNYAPSWGEWGSHPGTPKERP